MVWRRRRRRIVAVITIITSLSVTSDILDQVVDDSSSQVLTRDQEDTVLEQAEVEQQGRKELHGETIVGSCF